MDESINSLNVSAPCIVAFGASRNHIDNIRVIIESEVVPVANMATAIHFCFSCYYIFNMSFPPSFKLILLFLEKFVCNLKPSQKLPMSVVLVHNGMERVSDC